MAGTPAQNGNNAAGNNDSSRKTVGLVAGWPTAGAKDGDKSVRTMQGAEAEAARKGWSNDLCTAALGAWATPTARDWRSASGTDEFLAGRAEQTRGKPLSEQAFTLAHGARSNGSPAETASTGQLNPAFSLWLMGYPAAWVSCGVRAMQSFRKLPNKS